MRVSVAFQLGVAFVSTVAAWNVTGEATERVSVVVLGFRVRDEG